MRFLAVVAAAALASPQPCCVFPEPTSRPAPRTPENKLLTKPVTLAELAPATGTVIVHTRDGLARVPLDGSAAKIIDTIPGAMTADGAIRIHLSGARYRVRTDNDDLPVPDLVAADIGFLMAPGERHVAAGAETADGVQLAIISIADATARIIPLPMTKLWVHRWADDGSAFFHFDLGSETWKRVDVATGAITEMRPPVKTPDPDGSVVCAEKGFRLRFDIRDGRQRIVLDPIASRSNPEVLSGLRPRLLVEAEHHRVHRLEAQPATLAHLKLGKACDHFMFDFGGWVYLGEVATGKIAPLIRGYDAR